MVHQKVKNPGRKTDLLCKLSRAGQSKANACRNLHRLINRNNVLFPVPIDCGLVRVALRKPEYRTEQVYWPFLRMKDWIRCLLRESPKMLLAGYDLADAPGWTGVFSTFWSKYRLTNPSHCIFSDNLDTRYAIPYFLHGDEGRGYCRRPFMVESFQPVISHKGLDHINESGYLEEIDCALPVVSLKFRLGIPTFAVFPPNPRKNRHSMTTRFLLTCISSYFFDEENTLDDLHQFIAEDATDLYTNGITVLWLIYFLISPQNFLWDWPQEKTATPESITLPLTAVQVDSVTLRLVCLGTKGDWPYLRKDTRTMLIYKPLVWSFQHLGYETYCRVFWF